MRSWPITALAVAALGASTPAPSFGGEFSSRCRTVEMHVALTPAGPADHVLAGRLCRPPGPASTLQVLLSGATYGSAYWDFPLDPQRHSYVAAMTRAGHAVLNVDRIGTGRSSRPWPGSQVTFDAQVHVTHQVVRAARAGALGGKRFARVVTVGHSSGAAVALVEAARHSDVDGLILTGFLAHADPAGGPELLTSLYPAALEPRFGRLGPAYLTTRPATRGRLFYHPPGARGSVIARDEATKETTTPGELAGVLTQPGAAWVDEGIDVPVLSVVGEFDNVFCPTSCAAAGSPAFREAARYPNAPSFETFVQRRAGHVVNLHETAGDWFAAARSWLVRRMGDARRP